MIHKWVADLAMIVALAVWVANLALLVLVKDYDQGESVNTVVLAIIGGLALTRVKSNGNGNGGGNGGS